MDEFSFVRDLGSKPIYVVGEEEERLVFTFIRPCMYPKFKSSHRIPPNRERRLQVLISLPVTLSSTYIIAICLIGRLVQRAGTDSTP